MTYGRDALPAPADQVNMKLQAHLIATLRQQMANLFVVAVEKVGIEAARRIWIEASYLPRPRRGRPRKSELSSWEAWLLEMHDELKHDPSPKTLIRFLARVLNEHNPLYKHATREATERRLRRLLKNRAAGKLKRGDDSEQAIPHYKVLRSPTDI